MGVATRDTRANAPTVTVAASDSPYRYRADFICDGTNDNVQIQAALDAIATNGGTVRLMDGNYLSAPFIEVPSNTILEGCGPATVLKLADGSNNRFIVQKDWPTGTASNITLRDMTIDGNNTGQTKIGTGDSQGNAGCVDFKYTTNLAFENLILNDPWAAGLEITQCENVKILNNLVRRSADDSIGINEGCRHVLCYGNHIQDIAKNKYYGGPAGIEVQDHSEFVIVANNTMSFKDYTGAVSFNAISVISHPGVEACKHVIIANNIVESNVGELAYFIRADGVSSSDPLAYLEINNNLFKEASGELATKMRLQDIANAVISGNAVEGFGTYGLAFANSIADVKITNNIIRGAAQCIQFAASSDVDNLDIIGNTLEASYRIFDLVAGGISFTNVVVKDNDFRKVASNDWDFFFPDADTNTYTNFEVSGNRFTGWNMRYYPTTTDISDWIIKDNTGCDLDYSVGICIHGSTASTPRPVGFKVVEWIGSVEPTNATANDIWHITA